MDVYSNMGLHVDYSRSAEEDICYNVAEIFVQGHMPVMWNVCIPGCLVTLLIALGLYEVCLLT